MPKPPPTSPTSTRTMSVGIPSTSAASARLQRTRCDPLIDEIERDGVRRLGERGGAGFRIAVTDLAGNVPGRCGPDLWCAGIKRGERIDDRRQRLVVDLDRLGGIARHGARLGNDRGHRLADEATGLEC